MWDKCYHELIKCMIFNNILEKLDKKKTSNVE